MGGPYTDLLVAVVDRFSTDAGCIAAFGIVPGGPSKLMADTADPQSALPYALYSEPTEKITRAFGGAGYGTGSIEIGVFDATKQGARQKLALVRKALNGLAGTGGLDVGDGVLTYFRNDDGQSREIDTVAPGGAVTEYARQMTFRYVISRNDP